MNETTNGPIQAVMSELERHAREQMLATAERGGLTARRAMSGALTANETLVRVYSRRVRELEAQLADVLELAKVVPNPPPGHRWSSGMVATPGVLSCVTCMPRPVAELEPGPLVYTGEPAPIAHSFRLVPTTATECLATFMATGAVG